jgi:hypothetical protein
VKTSEVLTAARGLIDTPDKWAQEGGLSEVGPLCTAMACTSAAGSLSDSLPAQSVIARAAGLSGDYAATVGLFDWNDAPERTHTEVLAAFDTAISYAQAAEQEFSADACEPVDPYDYWTPELVQDVLDQHGEGPQR